MKPPDSLAQIVAEMVVLQSNLRLRKDDHLCASVAPTATFTYFVIGSSHPQNTRTVHITATMGVDATRKQRVKAGCSLIFYKDKKVLAERGYALNDFMRVVQDIFAFMDAGDMKPIPLPTATTQGKGVKPT